MKNRTRATRQVGHQNSIRLSIFFLTGDRKSTRLNSSHSQISYAVFCLKKKKKTITYFASSPPPSSTLLSDTTPCTNSFPPSTLSIHVLSTAVLSQTAASTCCVFMVTPPFLTAQAPQCVIAKA